MEKIRKIQATLAETDGVSNRIETGPLEINGDWPGTYIRGDDSFAYYLALSAAIKQVDTPLIRLQLESLKELLRRCRI